MAALPALISECGSPAIVDLDGARGAGSTGDARRHGHPFLVPQESRVRSLALHRSRALVAALGLVALAAVPLAAQSAAPVATQRTTVAPATVARPSAVVGAGAPGTPVAPLPAGAIADAVLMPGDVVRIAVWQKPEFSGDFAVGADGTISHPLYRVVQASGAPFQVVHGRIAEFLRRFDADPQFVAEPLLRVTLRGEVVRPNVYMLPPNTSLAQALSTAGGANERGKRDQLMLVRDGAASTIDLTAPAGAARQMIRSGDELVVERNRSVFREYILPAVTVIGAVAASISVVMRAQN